MITDNNAAIVAEIPGLKAQSVIMEQETRQANAKLIASAPELLYACQLFMKEWKDTLKDDYQDSPLQTVAVACELAIAKATS